MSKYDLIIGDIMEAGTFLTETTGWNSPNAKNKKSTSLHINGQKLDLTSLLSSLGNTQINSNSIQFTLPLNNQNNNNIPLPSNSNLNPLNPPVLNPNSNINTNNNNDNIPEFISFHSVISSSNVIALSFDENGNVFNLGQQSSNILSSILSKKKNKKQPNNINFNTITSSPINTETRKPNNNNNNNNNNDINTNNNDNDNNNPFQFP